MGTTSAIRALNAWLGPFCLIAMIQTAAAREQAPPVVPLASLDPSTVHRGSYGIQDVSFDRVVAATTTVGGGTFDVNAFLGADRYYEHTTPVTGQNTVAVNLEAGHFWNGHETLQHVATNTTNFVAGTESWGGGSIAAKYDAHATWAAMFIGGRQTLADPEIRQLGIAPGTDLRSAAIASVWLGSAYATGFDYTTESFLAPYQATFGVADVVNSSWGFTPDSAGIDQFTVVMDAYPFQNPTTTYVVSAGNGGPAADTVSSPGTGYNGITVAALGSANGFDTVAGFSSRGPTDFGYRVGANTAVVVPDARAAVDIAAPGQSLVSAFYGGQTGGNNTSLPNSVDHGTAPDAYSSVAGTSFSSPIVAGGATLVASAARTLPALSSNPNAAQSVVVKALLLNGADKTTGWSNGQQPVTVASDTFIRTTQALDWSVGAGRMNLASTFDLQVNGQTDVAGTATGVQGAVARSGWDFGDAVVGVSNDYPISAWLQGGTTLTTTLTWLRPRLFDFATREYADVAQADLNLSVWELDGENAFTSLIARSESPYNTVEHLSFTLPRSGFFGLRVEYPLNTFDNSTDDVWGTSPYPQEYGLSWQAVPEPDGAAAAMLTAALLAWGRRRRRS